MKTIISLDTETTGIDLYHGAKPFFITVCRENGIQNYWEWEVDPATRQPEIIYEDLADIQDAIMNADEYVLQNPKFDYTALRAADERLVSYWDWSKVRDTLLAGHLLASNQPHNLTDMALQYLGMDILPYELNLKEACVQARWMAKRDFPNWMIAKEGLEGMPSVKGSGGSKNSEKDSLWKNDMWLPKRLAKELGYNKDHPWWSVLSKYSNVDSSITLALWKEQEQLLINEKLMRIYEERLKILPVAAKMESIGMSYSKLRTEETLLDLCENSNNCKRVCENIATGYGHSLELPKSGNNKSLMEFVFKKLELPIIKRSEKTNEPSLDQEVLDKYLLTLPENSKKLLFIRRLLSKRKADTAISYLGGYERFQINGVLHPNLNPTGTYTLRWSSSNPNGQNISKKDGFNLRRCFGPAPGREWWSLDAKNIELRVAAYEANEPDMIDLFEHPDAPPYYGSNHLLVFDLIHPDKFAKYGVDCKKIYAATWYQWVKQGNFAVQFGAIDRDDGEGTADLAYRVKGAHRIVKQRFHKQEELNQEYIRKANRFGYVETLPDRTVDPERGYRIMCSRFGNGRNIEPTKPFSNHVQGTVGWWMGKAMVRCQEQLDEWNKSIGILNHYRMFLQVHDELLFDFPKGSHPLKRQESSNLGKVKELRKLMEKGGEDLIPRIPTTVGIEYHEFDWSEGVTVK